MIAPVCPKCQTTMDEGFVLDDTHGGTLQSKWAEGKPRTSFWLGVRVPRKDRHPVSTFRCPSCGYLESYAIIE